MVVEGILSGAPVRGKQFMINTENKRRGEGVGFLLCNTLLFPKVIAL